MLLRGIIPYLGNIVNKKSEQRRFRRRFLHPYSDPERRAGDSLFIRFPSGFTVAAILPPISSNTEKAASGCPFSFYHIRKPARRASPFLSFRFTLFLRGLGARLRRPRAILYITNIYNNVCLTGAFFKLFWGSFFRRKFAF